MVATASTLGPPASPQALANATGGNSQPLLHVFSLVVQKTPGATLGIDVTYSSAAKWTRNGLFVARVFEGGIVAEWNAHSEEPNIVHPGDFMFQVNGVHGETVQMVQEMKNKESLTIHLLRRNSVAAAGPYPTAGQVSAPIAPTPVTRLAAADCQSGNTRQHPLSPVLEEVGGVTATSPDVSVCTTDPQQQKPRPAAVRELLIEDKGGRGGITTTTTAPTPPGEGQENHRDNAEEEEACCEESSRLNRMRLQ